MCSSVMGGACLVVPQARLDWLYLFMTAGRIRYSRNVRAASCFVEATGIHRDRSRLTRHLTSAGSSVAGIAKVPTCAFGLILTISPMAHGPCRYIAALPLAKATLPSG